MFYILVLVAIGNLYLLIYFYFVIDGVMQYFIWDRLLFRYLLFIVDVGPHLLVVVIVAAVVVGGSFLLPLLPFLVCFPRHFLPHNMTNVFSL